MQLLLIGLGGFVGTILRYVLGGLVQGGAGSSVFPWGTLTINLLGCFGIGLLAELSEARGFLRPEMQGFLMVGILGGFTTFSAFANETVNALRDASMTNCVGQRARERGPRARCGLGRPPDRQRQLGPAS